MPVSSRTTAPKPATPPSMKKTASRVATETSVLQLDRRLDKEDPEVPGDVAHDRRRQPAFEEVLEAPEGAGDAGRAGEREVAGDQVDAAVDRRPHRRAGHPAQPLHQVAVDEPPPEELLARRDDQREGGRDEPAGRHPPALVDVGDVLCAGRHHAAGEAVADPEDAVEGGGGGEPEGEGAETGPVAGGTQLGGGGHRDRPHRADPERHLLPEVPAAPKGGGPDHAGQAETEGEVASPDQRTRQLRSRAEIRPARRRTPKRVWSRAV